MALNEWDRRFLAIAQQVSYWSKDPSTKVGAAIADAKGHIVALGYNGFPKNIEDLDERLFDRPTKYEMVIHAEVNAVLIAGRDAVGGTIYVYGAPICSRCATVLIQSGIQRVVADRPREGTDVVWDRIGKIALEMLAEAGVMIDLIDPDAGTEISE